MSEAGTGIEPVYTDLQSGEMPIETTLYGRNNPRTNQKQDRNLGNVDFPSANLSGGTEYRGIQIIEYDLPGHYAWADDTTGAADLAGSVEEAIRQIDQMKGDGE